METFRYTRAFADSISDVVRCAYYNEVTETLVVALGNPMLRRASWKWYKYDEVTLGDWNRFNEAVSRGGHYNSKIKSHFPSTGLLYAPILVETKGQPSMVISKPKAAATSNGRWTVSYIYKGNNMPTIEIDAITSDDAVRKVATKLRELNFHGANITAVGRTVDVNV